MTTKAPETIYAKVGYSDAADGVWSGIHNLRGDVCPPDSDETPFVRADLHATVVAERDALREAVEYVLDGYGLNAPDFKRQPEDDDEDDWIVARLRAALAKQEPKE